MRNVDKASDRAKRRAHEELSEPNRTALRAARFTEAGDTYLVVSLPSAAARLEHLSVSEMQICWALVQDMSYEAIAKLRDSSPNTVANQVSVLYRKLGVSSRAELVAACGEQ